MYTLNHTLEDNILEADGRYLDPQELFPLEQYLQGYTTRLATYQQLRDQSDKLVLYALRKLAQAHPDLIQHHGQRCKYDMTEVLRYIALSILRDDEVFFKEQMMSWLDTILLAYKRTNHCTIAYRYLQEAINAALPPANSTLTRPYLDIVLMSLQSHA
ncbi:MAG: phycobilisome protein [Leptolyngbyaceae bacterium]|nr:phycobilisome protein [Leptolyngbyaceae bacterium]